MMTIQLLIMVVTTTYNDHDDHNSTNTSLQIVKTRNASNDKTNQNMQARHRLATVFCNNVRIGASESRSCSNALSCFRLFVELDTNKK